jgi:hypothetical protein
MLLVLVIALLGQNFRVVLPIVAKDTFGGGPEVYGWLMAMLGLGAEAGALGSAARERVAPRSPLLAAVAFGVANLLMAMTPTLALAYLAVAAVGFANLTFNTLARTLLQLSTDRSAHGRVLALHSLMFLGHDAGGRAAARVGLRGLGRPGGLVVAGASALLAAAVALPVLRPRLAPPRPGDLGPDAGRDRPTPSDG